MNCFNERRETVCGAGGRESLSRSSNAVIKMRTAKAPVAMQAQAAISKGFRLRRGPLIGIPSGMAVKISGARMRSLHRGQLNAVPP